MAQEQQAGKRKSGTSAFSRWMQHRMNNRLMRKMRRGRDKFMGMDVLVLHTVGRRSGQSRETPVAWFADGEDARLVVGSGGEISTRIGTSSDGAPRAVVDGAAGAGPSR
ncbi:nitroreductase family deazaflavin-dependent oxidoreductase [Actinomadura rudentiformis]|uniref:nitroreductase family deazaflavin-dependent oxidoreductase n=1 Tax=Actinomadura rudentiformis TaxID=359158 RepID=UPI0021F44927|nr:nitroreductase family deazaflavin-dependent oxidoreductase [Actinomadura rudentiformis]